MNFVPVVQKYITCEGRFSTIHLYHMRFLLHLNGDNKMNLPYFLLKSLVKMSNKIQTHPNTAQYSIFHQGLIKVLVMQELNKTHLSWEQFLSSLGFEEQEKKTHKITPEKQPKDSKKASISSKKPLTAEIRAPSVTRETRSSKKKLSLQEENTLGQELYLSLENKVSLKLNRCILEKESKELQKSQIYLLKRYN
jgi:hypothetical protein